MFGDRRYRYPTFFVLFFLVVLLGFYINAKYKFLPSDVESIEVSFKNFVDKKDVPIVYISRGKESKINFETVYRFQNKGNLVYQCNLGNTKKTRKIRLYFPYPNKTVSIKAINLKSANDNISIPLQKFKNREGINCIVKSNNLKLEVLNKNGYIELPKTYIYYSDFKNIYQLILPLFAVLVLILFVLKSLKPITIKPFSVESVTLGLLVISVFLPAPIYNIALILMAVLNFRSISWTAIKSKKINLIIIGFFIIYLLNNLLISEESFKQMSIIERFLPFFILGIVLPSITDRRHLSLFPIMGIFIGFGFLLTSIFDAYIHQNFVFFSFDFFTKYLHPVYFSYLLFFSICYIDFYYKGKNKYLLELVLFVFLLFSGSKMVLLFSLVVVFLNLLKNKKTTILILPLIGVVILFKPLKNRFSEILNKEDFSVLKEKYIEDPFDKRINGLTFRLILWREALATMKGIDYVVGKGVTKQTNKLLEERLTSLGLLRHKNFNPHNQYVDTFWRTGVFGLLLLIFIPFYSLIIGIKRKDKLIIQFSLFMIAVMWSESIFGRVNGIYFFTTVILILMNSKNINENSNIRN